MPAAGALPDNAPIPPAHSGVAASRRGLLRAALRGGLVAAAVGGAAGIVRFLRPPRTLPAKGRLVVAAAELPGVDADPKYFAAGRFYLVRLRPGAGGNIRVPDAQVSPQGGILALNQACTHMGCRLPWRPDFEFEGQKGWFRCPCHGATYTREGNRVFGPAPRPMDTVPVAWNDDGSLSVRYDEIRRSGPDDAARAVPRHA